MNAFFTLKPEPEQMRARDLTTSDLRTHVSAKEKPPGMSRAASS
jgi:hypothetical protein